MGWDSIGSRVRALERVTMPSGTFVFIDLPSTTEAERRDAAVRFADARRAGRDFVSVTITVAPPKSAIRAEASPPQTDDGSDPE